MQRGCDGGGAEGNGPELAVAAARSAASWASSRWAAGMSDCRRSVARATRSATPVVSTMNSRSTQDRKSSVMSYDTMPMM